MGIKNLKILWKGLAIELTYNDDWSKVYHEIYRYSMAHLETRSENKYRLPITETGYLFHFKHSAEIEGYGSAEKFVINWLEHDAQT